MARVWILLGLLLGCPGKTDGGSTDDSTSGTDDSDSGGGTGDCPTDGSGPGVVTGVLLGSDSLPLPSGRVTLYDSTGSEDLVYDNVDDAGTYRLVYSQGVYLVRGEYSTCVGEDVPVVICEETTVELNLTLTCAP